jgi:hypothetical protein
MAYIYFDRCSCVGTFVPSTPQPKPCPPECLVATDVFVPATEGYTNTGGNITVDVGSVTNNTTSCADCLEYSIVDFNTQAFLGATIDSNGVITVTPNPNSGLSQSAYYKVRYKIECPCEGTRIEASVNVAYQSVTNPCSTYSQLFDSVNLGYSCGAGFSTNVPPSTSTKYEVFGQEVNPSTLLAPGEQTVVMSVGDCSQLFSLVVPSCYSCLSNGCQQDLTGFYTEPTCDNDCTPDCNSTATLIGVDSDCVFSLTSEHPDTQASGAIKITVANDDSDIEYSTRFIVRNCLGEVFNNSVVLGTYVRYFRMSTSPLIDGLGSLEGLTLSVRVANTSTTTVSLDLLSSAALSGCSGNVNPAHLIYYQSNPAQFEVAVGKAIRNLLCDAGYTNSDIDVTVTVTNSGAVHLDFLHKKVVTDTWAGPLQGVASLSWLSNGVDSAQTAVVTVVNEIPSLDYTWTTPCGKEVSMTVGIQGFPTSVNASTPTVFNPAVNPTVQGQITEKTDQTCTKTALSVTTNNCTLVSLEIQTLDIVLQQWDTIYAGSDQNVDVYAEGPKRAEVVCSECEIISNIVA